MAFEQIATSNNEENEAPKTSDLTKKEESNKIDYNLDKVDEQKFQEYKKMTDYIKENGWEYWDEYNNIMEKAIEPFEKQIQDILNKSNVNKISVENKDLSSMSDEALNQEAEKRLEPQPEELKWQKEIIKKINWNGSSEEIQRLNEIINNNMSDVQNFWKKIWWENRE